MTARAEQPKRPWVPPPPAEQVQRLKAECSACGKALPVKVFTEACRFFQSLVEQGVSIPDDLTIASSQCRCGSYTVLTARSLRFVP